MIFQSNPDFRAWYIKSLNEKAAKPNRAGGCLAALLSIFAVTLFASTGIALLFSVELTATILDDFGETIAQYSVWVIVGGFAVSVLLMILSIIVLVKANKKAKQSAQSIADALKERYGDSLYEEVKRQIIADDTIVIMRSAEQKSCIFCVTTDWLVSGMEFIRMDGVICAYSYLDVNRAGGGGVGLRFLKILLENGAFMEFPLDWPEGVIREIIDALSQRMPAIYTDVTQTSETIAVKTEDRKTLYLPNDKDKLIDSFKKRRLNLRRQAQ